MEKRDAEEFMSKLIDLINEAISNREDDRFGTYREEIALRDFLIESGLFK